MGHPFDTKRRIKRCMQIILILFVSFFVSVSCGIPSYFYMHDRDSGTSSSYYDFTNGGAIASYIDSYKLEFAIDISGATNVNVTSIDGPSLVYLYTIIPSNVDVGYISPKFISKFKNDYIKNNTGKPISSNVSDVMEIEYDSKTYIMNKFNLFDGGNSINRQIPLNYGLKLNSALTPLKQYNSSFGFKYQSLDNTHFEIILDQLNVDANNTSDHFILNGGTITDGIELRMYNDNNFLKKADDSIGDYSNIESGQEYKIIVYSALNVSEGNGFTNIFWSTLKEVGVIPSSGI